MRGKWGLVSTVYLDAGELGRWWEGTVPVPSGVVTWTVLKFKEKVCREVYQWTLFCIPCHPFKTCVFGVVLQVLTSVKSLLLKFPSFHSPLLFSDDYFFLLFRYFDGTPRVELFQDSSSMKDGTRVSLSLFSPICYRINWTVHLLYDTTLHTSDLYLSLKDFFLETSTHYPSKPQGLPSDL